MIVLSKISFHLSLIYRKTQYSIFIKKRFKSWKVLYFGSDDFSLVSLEALFNCLKKKQIEKLEVVSLSTLNPVFKFASKTNLKHHVWPPTLTECFDIGIVVSFGKLIPKAIIDYFPLGILNVHASLLPQYRGAMPIIHAIKNGESVTGITIMKIAPFQFDAGDIIIQEKYSLGKDDLMLYVRRRLAHLGAKCLIETLNDLPHSLEKSIPQFSENTSSAPKVKRDIAIVQWGKLTATEVYNLYRSLFGKYDLKTTFNSHSIKLKCISLDSPGQFQSLIAVNTPIPGNIEYSREDHRMWIHCRNGLLNVCSLQVKDKIITAQEFYNGYLQRTSKDKWIFQ